MRAWGPSIPAARLERFLQFCAEDNIQVCDPTTPAQYFHLLRRQIKQSLRKPLVVMTPKSLLRHPRATAELNELADGAFREIMDDPHGPENPQRVIVCSGKLFYALAERRSARKIDDTAIVRVEQFYPFPEKSSGIGSWKNSPAVALGSGRAPQYGRMGIYSPAT